MSEFKMPELPALDAERSIPYESIRYIPGYAEHIVHDYMLAYARLVAQQMREACAKECEARGRSYRDAKAPGWHEVDHEAVQNAAAIRSIQVGGEHAG